MMNTALHLHAASGCSACAGLGRLGTVPCSCALRSIHDQLFEDYSDQPVLGELDELQGHMEFRADFEATARRVLSRQEHWVWRLHYVHRVGVRSLIAFFSPYGVDDVTVRDTLYRAKAKVAMAAVESGLYVLRLD